MIITENFSRALEEFAQNNISKNHANEELIRKSEDLEFMYFLLSPLNREIKDIARLVVGLHGFEGSQVFEDYITREFLHQLVDQAIRKIDLEHSEFLRPIIELHIAHEIFARKRPLFRHVTR
ncbi:MAG: hypothetical protein FWD82_02510 [Defluviitaleaceae bacterium]|nr:hypothetical protein [Defluviitaleaceae bacterium]